MKTARIRWKHETAVAEDASARHERVGRGELPPGTGSPGRAAAALTTASRPLRWAHPVCALLLAVALGDAAPAADRPLIFPVPQKMEVHPVPFRLDETVSILVPEGRPAADLALARLLVAELSDRYGLALRITPATSVPPGRRYILIGSTANPLVQAECERQRLLVPAGAEAYALQVSKDAVLVAGRDAAGAFYGLQSLRQLVGRDGSAVRISGVAVEDQPHLPFRAIRLYLPGRENIAFFKRFLRDFMALYKFNRVIMEVNASMRLDRHPELNAGWIDFAKDLYYTQRYNPRGPNQTSQNSAHHDTADGDILEKEEVADLVEYARRLHIEVIPEIPTLTHSYYLLTRYKQFGAIRGAEWPDTYCPTHAPDIYKLIFDVFDEYIEVMKPKMIHLGHDEMFFPVELHCCAGKDMGEMFAKDVNKLHAYLTQKGIKVGIYGDHLIEAVRGAGFKTKTISITIAYQNRISYLSISFRNKTKMLL